MSTFAIGDEVLLPQGQKGILRWIGRISNRGAAEYAGIELTGPDAPRLGKHSGEHNGKQYFTTKSPGTGLFISYTTLVSTNIKTPRLPPPSPASFAAGDVSPTGDHSFQSGWGSPSRLATPNNASPTPRFHKMPSFNRLDENIPSQAKQAQSLEHQQQIDSLTAQLSRAQQDLQTQRNEYRASVQAVNEKVQELSTMFETNLTEVKADYEKKLRQAHRASLMGATPDSAQVEEQRVALAAMENKLITERSERQDEIDSLKRELENLRRVGGTAEDIEALVGDLGKYQNEIAVLRKKMSGVDALETELQELRATNIQLEKQLKANSKQPNAANEQLNAEKARVSELEMQIESLNAQLAENKKTTKNTNSTSQSSPQATPTSKSTHSPKPVSEPVSVPVPQSLSAYEQDTSIVDMAAGRTDWCSLCEREGHTAVECPYE